MAYIIEDDKRKHGHGQPCPPPPHPKSDSELDALKQQLENEIAEYKRRIRDLDNVALQGTNKSADNTAILTAIGNISIDTTTLAKQGTNAAATLSDTQTAAQNAAAAVKDGNDTAVGVAKEIRSEVGTGSDTAAESGTLFAVVKWVKDKVKAIYNAITDNASGLSVIASDAAAAKTAAQAITGYALQGSNSAKTNTQLSAEIADVATLIGYTIQEIDGV